MLRRVKYIKHPLTAGIPLKQKKKRGTLQQQPRPRSRCASDRSVAVMRVRTEEYESKRRDERRGYRDCVRAIR